MAKNFNFLKGTASGKVGETYYRQHGTFHRSDMSQSPKRLPYQKDDTDTAGGDCIVYMRIQKQHNNATQKRCWTAFIGLQRLAAAVSKAFWQLLGLSDKNRNRVNVVAEFLKATVAGRKFNPFLIYNTFPEATDITLDDPIFDQDRQTITCHYVNAMAVDATLQPQLLIVALQGKGINHGTLATWQTEQTIAFPTKFQNGDNIYIFMLVSVLEKGKRKIIAAKVAASNYSGWVGQTWRPNMMANGRWWFDNPKKVCGENVNYRYEGKRLILTSL